uniref:protein maelstrom homolog n=1 Tax=Myxine glutinosa TaxID=7769 RepID=UPI00358E1B19
MAVMESTDWTLTCGKDPSTQVLVFLDFQSLAILPPTHELRVLPCEVAAVAYSLREGIIKKFHSFIDPGPIPLGFRYLCKSTSEFTHQLPLDGPPEGIGDPGLVANDLLDFIRKSTRKPYVVFCAECEKQKVDYCLQWLSEKTVFPCIAPLSLQPLLVKYYTQAGAPSPTLYSATQLLSLSTWDFHSKSRCNFHSDIDVKHCALGTVNRLAYCLSNCLAPIHNITLTSSHIPPIPEASVEQCVL